MARGRRDGEGAIERSKSHTVIDLDVEDGTELPVLMGWSGGHDFVSERRRFMVEVAEELSPAERKGKDGKH